MKMKRMTMRTRRRQKKIRMVNTTTTAGLVLVAFYSYLSWTAIIATVSLLSVVSTVAAFQSCSSSYYDTQYGRINHDRITIAAPLRMRHAHNNRHRSPLPLHHLHLPSVHAVCSIRRRSSSSSSSNYYYNNNYYYYNSNHYQQRGAASVGTRQPPLWTHPNPSRINPNINNHTTASDTTTTTTPMMEPLMSTVIVSSSSASAEKTETSPPPPTSPLPLPMNSPFSNTTTTSSSTTMTPSTFKKWPCGDALDQRLVKISLPVMGNFALGPVMGAVDLFYINQMRNARAVAGSSAAHQICTSLFYLTSFLPALTAPLISRAYASSARARASAASTSSSSSSAQQNMAGVQEAVHQALGVGTVLALASTLLVLLYPEAVLSSVLPRHAPALEFARPYLFIRAFSFLPSMISLVGFAAFRGVLDTVTPVKIALCANFINFVLDPLLMFGPVHVPWLRLGVVGAALATLISELVSAMTYLVLLRRQHLMGDPIPVLRRRMGSAMLLHRLRKKKKKKKKSSLSSSESSSLRKTTDTPRRSRTAVGGMTMRVVPQQWMNKWRPLLQGGLALQVRTVALNLVFVAVARVVQGLDPETGIAAAAHALSIQTFQVGGIVLLALSTVAQTIVPSDMMIMQQRSGDHNDHNRSSIHKSSRYVVAQQTVQRLMRWGALLGWILGSVQLALWPIIRRSSPLVAVREAARVPALLASLFQVMNGLVFIGEGVMIGTGDYAQLSVSTVVATLGCIGALTLFPRRFGLTGVWLSFGVFNALRLLGVALHQYVTSPLVVATSSSSSSSSSPQRNHNRDRFNPNDNSNNSSSSSTSSSSGTGDGLRKSA